MKPHVVLAITDQERNAQLKSLGVSFLELRVDLFKSQDISYCVKQIKHRRALKIPLVLTIRNQKKEGAVKEFADSKKWALMQALIGLVDWVDIELSSPLCARVLSLAKASKVKVVLSTHNFINIPTNMEHLFKKSLSLRVDMVKFSFTANSDEDLIHMINFTHHHRKQAIVTMCLGSFGAISRLILPFAGSRWVYSFLNRPTAPGQLGIKTLQSHLSIYH